MTTDRSQAIGATLAALWLVLCVAGDAVTGPDYMLSPLYVLSPLIASAVLPARATSVFAAASIVAAAAAGWWDDTWGDPQQVVRLLSVVLVSTAAVAVAVVRVRREQRHERVAAIAEVAQRAVLPTLPKRVGTLALGARYLSAAQDAVVGGDLYDYYYSRDHMRFLVGDVRGKGIDAVGQAARVIRAFRQSASTLGTLPDVARDMSSYLMSFFDDEEFVTAVLVDASEEGQLTLVSCGHPPPLLVGRGGKATLVEAPAGLPLGLGDSYDSVTVPWSAGDRLLMYTDGLSEARDEQAEFLPIEPLSRLMTKATVEEALDAVLGEVRRHVPGGRLTDDLAVLVLENQAVARVSESDTQEQVPVAH